MCNCKKQPRIETPYPVVTVPVINMVPESSIYGTPEPIRELTDEEIDWFNNIDIIDPLNQEDDE